MSTDVLQEFCSAAHERGLILSIGDIQADGGLHRCDVEANGSSGKGDGAYILHMDERPAGGFENWRDGAGWQTWSSKKTQPMTAADREAFRIRLEEQKRASDKAKAERRADAKRRAAEIWTAAKECPQDHPYLTAKQVKPRKLKLYRGDMTLDGMACDGAIIVPLLDELREVAALQFISAKGEKRFFGPNGGYSYPISKVANEGGTLLVCEGVATGLSLFECTNLPVAVALNTGNLLKVGRAMRERHGPQLRLIYCADDDAGTAGNPGIRSATEAASETAGLVALPDFGDERPEGATDFNDLHMARGVEAVKKAVEGARAPEGVLVQATAVRPPRGSDSGGWPMPKPLPNELRPVAAFDYRLLPSSIGPWVQDICEQTQAPPDFIGASVMVALGSVIGRQIGIRPQAESSWTESANLWGLIIGRPGIMKSPSTEAATAPVKRLQAEAAERYQAERIEYEQGLKRSKLQQEAGEKAARKKLATSMNADVSQELSVSDPEEPLPKRYIGNDSSYEALGELLRGNPNGILVYRDELVSLLQALDREDNAAARGFYLSGWSGSQSYDFDRITRKGARLEAVCLSVLGSTQPGRIASYVRTAVKGGAGDDGLIQRFGIMVWPDVAPEWRDVDRVPDSEARKAAFETFRRLDGMNAEAIGAAQDHNYSGEPEGIPYLRLAPDALALFREWRAALEARLRGGHEDPALESHFSKYRKLVPSLALILHLAEGEPGAVAHAAMLKALAWADYLETHARRVYASITSPEQSAARAIVSRLKRGEIQPTFRGRDIYRRGWAHLAERDVVMDALELLVDLDWLAKSTTETDGRPATQYEANPRGLL